jgi:iron complex transport system permease protein
MTASQGIAFGNPPCPPGAMRRRHAVVVGALVLGCLVMGGLSITTGSYDLRPGEILNAMLGRSDNIGRLVVVGMRLPRVVASLCVGAGLGVAGKIFQSLCRNPLASPDLLGFTTGSATGALVGILLLGQSGIGIAAGALIGGGAASAAVYLLTLRRGLRGERFILAGIAVSAMLAAFNEYLITRADLEKAEAAKTWLFGSLNGISWQRVDVLAPGMVGLLICARLFWPWLKMLEMGDDLATGLGLPTRRSRLLLMGVGIALAALATALAGPVHFLALAAAPLARGLLRSADTGVAPAAAMGALLLTTADFLAQHLMAPFQIPVGLVTGAIGGAYLIVLLTRRTGGTGQ